MFLFHYHRFHRFIVNYISTGPYQHPPIITALKQKKYKCFFVDLATPPPPDPLYCLLSILKFYQTPSPSDQPRSNKLFCLMILWTYNFRALVPCCVFHATRHQIYCRFDTDDMVFASTLI